MKPRINAKTLIVAVVAVMSGLGLVFAVSAANCNGMKYCGNTVDNGCTAGTPCNYTTYGGTVTCSDCVTGECGDYCVTISCSTVDRVYHTGGTCIQDAGNPAVWRCEGGAESDPTPETCCSTSGGTCTQDPPCPPPG